MIQDKLPLLFGLKEFELELKFWGPPGAEKIEEEKGFFLSVAVGGCFGPPPLLFNLIFRAWLMAMGVDTPSYPIP